MVRFALWVVLQVGTVVPVVGTLPVVGTFVRLLGTTVAVGTQQPRVGTPQLRVGTPTVERSVVAVGMQQHRWAIPTAPIAPVFWLVDWAFPIVPTVGFVVGLCIWHILLG